MRYHTSSRGRYDKVPFVTTPSPSEMEDHIYLMPSARSCLILEKAFIWDCSKRSKEEDCHTQLHRHAAAVLVVWLPYNLVEVDEVSPTLESRSRTLPSIMPDGATQTTPAASPALVCVGALCRRDLAIFSSTDDNDIEHWLSSYKGVSAHK